MEIKQNILNAVNEWLTPTFDATTQLAVKELIAGSQRTRRKFLKTLSLELVECAV
jgi:hypothetical protein